MAQKRQDCQVLLREKKSKYLAMAGSVSLCQQLVGAELALRPKSVSHQLDPVPTTSCSLIRSGSLPGPDGAHQQDAASFPKEESDWTRQVQSETLELREIPEQSQKTN